VDGMEKRGAEEGRELVARSKEVRLGGPFGPRGPRFVLLLTRGSAAVPTGDAVLAREILKKKKSFST
jgi:hypothetical protein